MNLKIYEKTKYNNIYKHRLNGTYAVDLSLGYDSTGKRIRTTTTGILTEKEAKKILSDEQLKKQKKVIITESSIFEDYIDEYFKWCLDYKHLKPTSVKNKKGRFTINITPFFGKMKITSITDKDIVNFHKYLDEKDLKPQSKSTIHKQLSAYFNWLVDYKRIIYTNPCKIVANYKIPKSHILHYTIDEMNLLFDTIENDSDRDIKTKYLIKAILKLFFFSGLRVGELFGLKFKDIDFDLLNKTIVDKDNIRIELNQTVYYTTGGWIESDGKTDGSLQPIYVGKNVIQSLLDYILYMKNEVVFDIDDYVFTNSLSGKIYSQESIRRHINYYENKAGLKHIALKDLRHSHATFLLSIGYHLEDVKDRLRHSSYKTTETYYATFYEEVRQKLANDIDSYAK